MTFNSDKKRKNNPKGISIIKKLRSENKSSEEFELLISRLSLEELIWLKLELTTRQIKNNRLFGFPFFERFPRITRDALLNFALFSFPSKKEAASFLGVTETRFDKLIKKYKCESYINGYLVPPS